MAAYSAVACFRQTLQQLLDSDQLPLHFSKPQIEYLYEKVSFLQSSLDKTPFVPKNWGNHWNKLQTRIRDAVYAAQDSIDYSIIREKADELPFNEIAAAIDLAAAEAYDRAEAIRDDPQAQNLLSEKPPPPPSPAKSRLDMTKRLEEDLKAVKDLLLWSEDSQRLVVPITGPAGLGKTTLARKIYEDEETKARFSARAWVTVSRKYSFNQIFSKLLSCVGSEDAQGDEETLLNLLHHQLYSLRYLVVIDDVWEAKVWDRVAQALPDTGNGSRVVVTTRNPKIGRSIQENGYVHTMKPLQSSSSLKDKIVGQEEDFKAVTHLLLSSEDKQRLVIPITGLPGLGKTTLARSIYESRQVVNNFDIRAWVTVSQDYNFQEVFSNLLSSMESKNYEAGHYAMQGDEQALIIRFHQELYNHRYLVVVDDVWDIRAWDRISIALPDNENGSRILLTSRIKGVAESIRGDGYVHMMRPLGMEESWKLLCHKVFDEVEGEVDITKACPPDLKEIGRRIAKKCKGLPLSITVVGGLLRQERTNVEYWKRTEEDVGGAAANGEDSYMNVLSLSYTQLPAKLKACFLYMGAFPEDSEIRVSKLIKLWVAEGFLTSPSLLDRGMEGVARTILDDLVGRNLISVREKSSNGGIKLCSVHDSLRELAERESRIEKFFHSRKKYSQRLEEGLEEQRRVSIHMNLLMSLDKVYESTRSITYARTLLYLGPHHHHPMPFCLAFDLLRVLDAFTVYFIRFPDEFLQLVHLTYLSLTYNHDLPSKISQLQKLQTLMVRRQPKLIFIGASFLPDEIWEMRELRHLWFTESDFPALPPSPPQMPVLLNLQTLTNVNAAFFTDEVLDNMPNLKKLAMWIEAPDKLNFNVSKFHQLEHFKFVVLNPVPGKGIEVEAEQFFPKTLKRVTLSGCGLPWEYMEYVAGNLPDLEVLKLKELAFHGYEWCPDYNFKNLKYLLIEYLNIQIWEAKYSNYPSLRRLILRHCYDLKGIPQDLGFIGPLELIDLVDCSPQAIESASDIMEEQEAFDKANFQVRIFSSWD